MTNVMIQSFFCSVGFHKWEGWSKPQMVTIMRQNATKGKYGKTTKVQFNHCHVCKKEVHRTLD